MRALLGTRKGLLVLEATADGWRVAATHFDGVRASIALRDASHGRVWAGLNHGHWGPKLHVSDDGGNTFTELDTPAFPEGHADSLKDFWSLATDSTGRLWLGVEPAALFYSDDQGGSWSLCEGFDQVHGREQWFGAGTDEHCLHSVIVDPRDDHHLYAGVSVAGMLESRDRGASWSYINKGLSAEFLPDPKAEVGHDPHKTIIAPSNPDVLWQQNHCGIYRSTDGGQHWDDLSKAPGLASAFGFAIAVDEQDADVAFTIPAVSDEVRVPVSKRLCVQKTTDGGQSWHVIRNGFANRLCYDIVYRNAFALKGDTLAFGSTTGSVWTSRDGGASWQHFPASLPAIYSVALMD